MCHLEKGKVQLNSMVKNIVRKRENRKKSWLRLSLILGFIITTTFTLVACRPEPTTPIEVIEEDEDRIRIGITFDTFVLERWIRDRDVFVYTAQGLGAEVDVQNAHGDLDRQISQIEEFIRQEKDAIVIVAVDCYGLQTVVERARTANIPIISYDRMIQNAITDLYITVDSVLVGEAMAHVVDQRLPDGGNVVMMTGPVTDANSRLVADGFIGYLDRVNSEVRIIDQIAVPAWTPEYGFEVANQILDRHRNIDAIMCGNDGLAGFAIQALSLRQLAGEIIVTGQDADIEACQRVVEGTQAMTVYKPIETLAMMAAHYAVRLAMGEDLDEITQFMANQVGNVPFVGLVPIAVTMDNIEEVILDSGFHLREDVFRNVDLW
jgi:D-xylose transport system substrate-binding protein